MKCTYRKPGGPGEMTILCKQNATDELTWHVTLDDGWTVSTRRCYCQQHTDEQLAALRKQNVAAARERL